MVALCLKDMLDLPGETIICLLAQFFIYPQMDDRGCVNYFTPEACFDDFCLSSSLGDILLKFDKLCDILQVPVLPGDRLFYRSIRQKLIRYWKAESLFHKLDFKFNDEQYASQEACSGLQALVVGCGPCGLRCAIELAVLGAKVIVVEKRTSFSRHNILHLWPFLIHDLKSLGAKTFFGKFCAGSIDHISIRTLQCILLKVALLFGVQVVTGVTFMKLVEPTDSEDTVNACGDGPTRIYETRPSRPLFTFHDGKKARFGWRAEFKPFHRALSSFEFDIMIGAAGKSNSCLDFPRKELRCRLAIAVTANFVNYNTADEARVEEISGVASIFNQQYFSLLSKTLGIELENLVYYKDETHYFVMTAKKHSLLSKGVLKKDLEDPGKLLHPDNVDLDALQRLSRDVATFATHGGLSRLDFALNAYGQPDVAIFDFTSLSAAEYACRIVDRLGRPLCQCLVGDALVEPFWPTGSGCALGFLSALDAAWAVSLFAAGHHPLKIVAWRDSVYQRLSQTSPSNMPQNFASHALSPNTRYTCCDLELVRPMQVRHLYDNTTTAQMTERSAFSYLRESLKSSPQSALASSRTPHSPSSNGARSSCPPPTSPDVCVLKWFQISLSPYISANLCPPIPDLSASSWRCGRALLCLLHKYKSGLVSLGKLQVITPECETTEGVTPQLEEANSLISEHFSLPLPSNLLGSSCMDNQSDPSAWPVYLLALCLRLRTLAPSEDYASLFVCKNETTATDKSVTPSPIRRPHLSQFNPSRSFDPLSLPRSPQRNRQSQLSVAGCQSTAKIKHLAERLVKRPTSTPAGATVACSTVCREDPTTKVEKGIISKRRSELISMLNDPASAKRRSMLLEYQTQADETASSPLRLRRAASSAQGSQEALNIGLAGTESKGSSKAKQLPFNLEKPTKPTDFCVVCKKRLYAAEYRSFEGYRVHPGCFRCAQCQRSLRPEIAHCYRPDSQPGQDPVFYCTAHFKRQQLERMQSTKCPGKSKAAASVAPLNCTSAPVKRRAHNTPSLFYNLVPTPPGQAAPSDSRHRRVSPHPRTRQPMSSGLRVNGKSAARQDPRRQAPMASASDQLFLNLPPGHPSQLRLRGTPEPRGIRDEPAPHPSLSTLSISDTLGMPESVRQATFESRLCESLLSSCAFRALTVPDRSSTPATDLQDDSYLATTESGSESTDDVTNTSLWGDHQSPISLERMLSICRAMRADALYRRSHPSAEGSSSSSSPSPSERLSDAEDSTAPGAAYRSGGHVGISAPIYENARWTLDRPEKFSQKSVAAAGPSTSFLAQKYGLLDPSPVTTAADSTPSTLRSFNSLLAAKERFCMEPPKPVSIDPVAFLGNKNREASHITSLSDCSECVESLPQLFSPTRPISLSVENDNLHSCLDFQQPSWQHACPLTCYASVLSPLQGLHSTTSHFLLTTLHRAEKLRTLPPDTWHEATVHTVATLTSPPLHLTEPPLVRQVNPVAAFTPSTTPGDDIRDIDSHSIMTVSPEKSDDEEKSLPSSAVSHSDGLHDEDQVECRLPDVVEQPKTDEETPAVEGDSFHRRVLAPPLELNELRLEVEQLDYLTRSQTAPEFMKTARKGSVSGEEQSYSMPSRSIRNGNSRGKKASDESGIAISHRPVPLFIYTTRLYSDSDTEDLFPCRTEEEEVTDSSDATTTSYSDSDSATSTSRLPMAAAVPEAPIVPVNKVCASCSPPLSLNFPSVDLNSIPASDVRKQRIEQLKRHLEQLADQMKVLEDKGMATERELRRIESSTRPECIVGPNASAVLCSSEPDITCLTTSTMALFKYKRRELTPNTGKRSKFSLRRPRRPQHEEQAAYPDTLPRARVAFTNCTATVGQSEMQELRTCDPVEETYLRAKRSHLFSELLNIVSRRNNLITREAELVSQVKQLELELYQDALETAYRTLHSSSPPPPPLMPSSSSRPPVCSPLRKGSRWRVPFRRQHKSTSDPCAHDYCQRRSASLETWARDVSTNQCALQPRRQDSEQSESLEGQLLLSEIWRVINERTTRSVVRDKTMQCASLQEMSVRRLLSRHKGNFQSAFSSASRHHSVVGGGCLGR